MKKQNKTIMKRVCSLMLCLMMLITVVPPSTMQAEELPEESTAIEQSTESETDTELTAIDETETTEVEEPEAETTEVEEPEEETTEVEETEEETTEVEETEAETTEVEETEAETTEVADTTAEDGIAVVSEETAVEAGIAVAQADTTAPVIESIVSFDGKGQTIQPDTELHLIVSVYDDGEISWENSSISIIRDDHTGSSAEITKVEKLEGNQYKLTLNVSWHAGYSCHIGRFTLRDTAGNQTMLDFGEEDYPFIVELPEKEGVKVTAITFSETNIELTNEITEYEMGVTATLEGDITDLPDYIYLDFIDPDGSGFLLLLFQNVNDTQFYEGTQTFSYYSREGTYTFKRAEIYAEAQIRYDGETPAFTLVKNNTDKKGPVIENLVLKKDGKELENGALLKKDDSIDISVEIKDEGKISDVSLNFETVLSDVSSYKYVYLSYDEKTGCYIASVPLTDFYATEWYVSSVSASDVYTNSSSLSFKEKYFYVTEADGSCSIPNYTYDVEFYINNQWERYTVTSGRVISLKELFPNGVPEAPVKEGYEFLGWYVDGELVQEDDVLFANGYSMYIYPAYDKVDVEIRVSYCNEDGKFVEDEIKKTVDSGTTYQTIYDSLDLSYKHSTEVTFEGWDCRIDFDEEIYRDAYISIDAVYDKLVISLSFRYYDENDTYQYDKRISQIMEKGLTYAEVMEQIVVPELVHSKEKKFIEWERDNWYLEMYPNEKCSQGTIFYYTAVYEDESQLTPENPTTPENPSISEKPTTPENPSISEKPTTPENPSISEKPTTPENPSISEKPTIPENSTIPENPSISEKPTIPENPVVPEDTEKEESSSTGGGWYYDETIDGSQEEVLAQSSQPTQQIQSSQQTQTPVGTQESQRDEEEVSEETEVPVAVKLEEAVIEAEVERVTQAAESEQLVISMTKEDGSVATEIPVAVLEAARGKNVDIVLDMGGYSWTINGNDILATDLQAINLEVSMDTEAVAPSIVNALAGGEPTRQLSLTHNGDFGFKAKLNINVGSEYEGQFGNLYYYDSNNKLVFMNAGQVQADGSVSLDFSHASDYVVVVGRDRTEEETAVVENTEVMEEETEEVVTEAPAVEKRNTGAVVGVIAALVAVIAVAVFALKKKSSK